MDLKNLSSPYILYRFPDEENFVFEELTIADKNDFTFQIQSFNQEKNYFFKGLKNFEINPKDFPSENLNEISQGLKFFESPIFTWEIYRNKCDFFIQEIQKGRFEKLVLSRIFKGLKNPNLGELFANLSKKYPKALIYLLHLGDEIWLGATPELLLEIKNNKLQTMALAGTRSTEYPHPWTEKELYEHQVVVDYISKALENLNPKVEETKTITLNNLQHLMTPISANWSDESAVEHLISRLHPTPAVCGLPQREAFEFILENEGYNRSFYTGILGFKNQTSITYFVNLRCARISHSGMDVFVGGGITAASQALAEWEETELKAKVLLDF